uniref:Protein krueppel n=1 Tax=Glossina brevipalpis TaxID=37001 RepID=A0A1A9WH22_9MUSC
MEISIKWNICRVCLQEEPDSKGGGHMRYIFGDNSEELAQEIYECTGITMRPDDNLPQKICRRCFNILRSTVYFRKTCRESDKYLQSVIQRTKSASTLFKLDRKDNSRCKFLDKNAEDFYYFENNAEDDTIDDIGAESSIREDAIKRKPRFGRFIRKKMRSLDMPTSSTLITIKEHEYQIPDSGGYEEETNDMGLMDIIEKGDDEKYMDNEEHYVSHDNEEEDAVKSGEEIIGETYERVEPDAIETREEYEGDEHNNNSNENYTDNCHDNNSIALKTSNFAKLHNIVTKLPTPEENDGKNGTIDEVEVNDDNAGETNFESDIVVKREEIYILLNESDDQTEVRASIDNQDHPNVEYVSGEEDDLDLETLDDLESAQVTSTVRGNGEVKSDEHDIEESPSNLSYPDAQPPQNPGFVVTEYIIPDVTESQVKKEDAAVGKGKITFVKARSTRVKKDGTINNNFAAVTTINCNVCGNMFTSRHLLNAHMRIHRQEKPHECEVHTNEKPFTCEYCSKSFALSTTLQAHIKVHTGERPYKCGPCSKSFKLPHQLKAHQNTHLHKAVEQSTM